uniref:LNS2/PITP domain-containing protein n=1 Tax=Percolomonas cosmopolitus TaxID=63605 RepID=A0A6U0JSC1_9EUKA|mmetsp:Transcript_1151/g.3940  ORF Transcript_1151/g.3940 Transcript_1151/m.3940 type:complete len:803 (+) Transcript_1151:2545-4953(+)
MSSLLTYLNSATDMFGGAIDVIVIKQPDGTLRTTPFHVRFGRLKLLRSTEKIIRIMINGKLTDMVMKISSQDGVAYFIQSHESTQYDEQGSDRDSFTSSTSSLPSIFDEGTTSPESGGGSPLSDSISEDGKWTEMDFDPIAATSEEDGASSDDKELDDSTTFEDKVKEQLLRESAEMTEKEMDAHEIQRDHDTGVNAETDSQQNDDGSRASPMTQPDSGNGTPTPSSAEQDTAAAAQKKPRWQWMQKIFGLQNGSDEKDIIDKNEFVEQTLMETLKKKYHYEIDEHSESSGEDDTLVFEIDDLDNHHHRASREDMKKAKTAPTKKQAASRPVPPNRMSSSAELSSSLSTSSPRDLRSSYLSIHDDYNSDDDGTSTDMSASLTPSLPPQMRESIRELNQRPFSSSLPRNFGAKNLFPHPQQSPENTTDFIESPIAAGPIPETIAAREQSSLSPKHVSFKTENPLNSSTNSIGSSVSGDVVTSPAAAEPAAEQLAGTRGEQQVPAQDSESMKNPWWWFAKRTPQQQKGPPKLRTKKASKPLQKQLQALDLRRGKNTIKYIVTGRVLGTQEIEASLYLWNYDDKIIISDVDGTITKSDGLGHVLPLLGMDWSHTGIAELYTSIMKNGYKIIYLTSRSIVQSATTKVYISSLRQGKLKLPEGPVILSSDRLFACLTREVVLRRPEEFKIAALQEIKSLFASKDNPQPFFAGFGNRKTDIISYRTVGVPDHKIFTIDPSGNIKVYDNLNHKSYTDVHQLVNLMFPDVKSKFLSTDLTYWNLGIPSVQSIENLSSMNKRITEEEEGEA